MSPLQVVQLSPLKDARLLSLLFITNRVPRKRAPFQVPLTEFPLREMLHSQNLQLILEVSGRRIHHPQVPKGNPIRETVI